MKIMVVKLYKLKNKIKNKTETTRTKLLAL